MKIGQCGRTEPYPAGGELGCQPTESYGLSKALDTTPQRVWTPEELVAIALPLPVYFGPGEGFHYSNTNTVLLGLIAEKLDGKGFGQIVRDRILRPLGLNQTSFPGRTLRAFRSLSPAAICTWTTSSPCPRPSFRRA